MLRLGKLLKSGRAVTILDQATVSLGNFILVIVISKLLMPDEFGLYTVIWMSVIAFGSIVNSWFSGPLFTIYPSLELNENEEFLRKLIGEFYFLIAILSLVFLLCMSLVYVFRVPWSGGALLLILAGIAFYSYDFFRKVAILKRNNRTILLVDICAYFVPIMVFVISNDYDFLHISITLTATYFFASVFVVASLPGDLKVACSRMPSRLSFDVRRRRTEYSKWISLSSVFQIVSGGGVYAMAAFFIPLSEIGLLRIAQTLTSVVNPVYVYLENHARMEFADVLKRRGKIIMEKNYYRFSMFFLIALLAICLIFSTLSDFIVFIIYPEYVDSELSFYFRGFMILSFLIGINYILRLKRNIFEKTRIIFISYVVGAVSVVGVIYPLTFLAGAFGIILTMICAQVLTSGVMWRWNI